MNEEQKKAYEELQTQIAKDITPAITEAVTKEVFAKLPDKSKLQDGAQTKDLESKEKVAEYIKAKFLGDTSTCLKLGVQKSMDTGTPGSGQEFVPTELSSEIIRLIPQYGIARKYARQWPVVDQIQKIPTASGVTVNRVGEKASIGGSHLNTGNITLTMKKLACKIPLSNELLRYTNVKLVDLIIQMAAEKFAEKEDEWMLRGLAAGEGIFGNTNVPNVVLPTGNTTYDKVQFENFLDAMSLMNDFAVGNAKIVMSFSVLNALRKLRTTVGTDPQAFIYQAPGAGMPSTIFNLPVITTPVMPKTTDSGSQANKKFASLVNFDYVVMGVDSNYELLISKEASYLDVDGTTTVSAFDQDMTVLRLIERVDIQIAEPDKAFATLATSAT